ncbi:MAG TPA: aldehyde dehydrogenase family protein [Gaiellaceae bacterium]|nr:aldehyde dehydrogenase family protein [Gaiellaceae bacterium]
MSDVIEAPARPDGRNYVGGEWRPSSSGATYTKQNPMRPAEAVGEFSASTEADAADAVGAAAAAFEAWAALPIARRGAYLVAAAASLEARVEEIARDMSTEMGKPLREARLETGRAAQILRFAASEAFRPVGEHFEQAATGAQVSTYRRPVGVVALITPWNFPIAIPVWKLAPALIYGNAVVLKLAYEAPLTGLHVAEAFAEAELPAGVLNVLTGRGSTVGAALVHDARVRAISFTGSVATGHWVRDEATKAGKRVQLELGGQNPLIVMDDADLPRAVEAAYAGAFWSAGQKCTATRRILVQDGVYDEFRAQLLARVERGRVGDPLDPDVEVGPIVNESQFDEVVGAIRRGRDEGGTVIAGGERADDDGYLLPPTVFEGVEDDAFLSCEEVFGPVTTLYRFGDLDDALARANAVPFGLSTAIFTSSLATATRFQREAQAGLIHVNSQTAGADVHVPFGGIKSSGFGPHEQGRAAVEFYTEVVTVYVDP